MSDRLEGYQRDTQRALNAFDKIKAEPRYHKTVQYVRWMLRRLLEVLYVFDKELQGARAGYDACKNVPQEQHKVLINNLAAKIRRQKLVINQQSMLIDHYRARGRLAEQAFLDVRKAREPLLQHYGAIKRAAQEGNLIRVLALLEDWDQTIR